jgi:hypothetical protein
MNKKLCNLLERVRDIELMILVNQIDLINAKKGIVENNVRILRIYMKISENLDVLYKRTSKIGFRVINENKAKVKKIMQQIKKIEENIQQEPFKEKKIINEKVKEVKRLMKESEDILLIIKEISTYILKERKKIKNKLEKIK